MRKRFAVSAVLFLCGGLVLIPCHTAMGQCAVVNLLQGDLGDLQNPSDVVTYVRKPWLIYPTGEQVRIYQGSTQFPHTIGVFHDLHQSGVLLSANIEYELTANVRTSPNMREGFLGFRGVGLPKPHQTQFGPLTAFKTVRIKFTPTQAGGYEVFIGYWARDKEASINVEHVRLVALSGGCNDSVPQS
jgi:hypothetical protein